MLFKNGNSVQRLVLSCTIVCGFVVPLSTLATVATLPVVSPSLNGSLEQNRTELFAVLPKNVVPHYVSRLSSLYRTNQMQSMWQDPEAVLQFQQQLAELAMSGVQPQFTQWVKWLADPSITDLARDIVLSDAMLGYLQFVSLVSANGNTWLYGSGPYKLSEPLEPVISQWQDSVQSGNTRTYISTLAPQHSQYKKMRQALGEMLADDRPWPQIASGPSLRPGQLSDEIPALREILTRTGMLIVSPVVTPSPSQPEVAVVTIENTLTDDFSVDEEKRHDGGKAIISPSVVPVKDIATPPNTSNLQQSSSPVSVIDNLYDHDLVEGVKRFQVWQGLTPDGVIGVRTREWLNVSPQMRASLLALNIQRLRILPDQMNTGIMVNIPNYSLVYYLKGKEVLSSRVIVGRPSRKTPLMSSALNNVVVNPPWNVPVKLIREDIAPKARYDANYFQKHGYRVFSGWSNDAEVIDPSMIDWSTISPRSFPYRVQQAPGAGNSLGRFKFNMPSSDAIYLHDTPSHGLFQKDLRALSSGCVRVNKASELATMLLQDVGWDHARLSSTVKQGNTTYVNIRQHIPVQLYYLTAWVSDDGKPQFRTDIYNYDHTVRSGAQILAQAEKLMLSTQ